MVFKLTDFSVRSGLVIVQQGLGLRQTFISPFFLFSFLFSHWNPQKPCLELTKPEGKLSESLELETADKNILIITKTRLYISVKKKFHFSEQNTDIYALYETEFNKIFI